MAGQYHLADELTSFVVLKKDSLLDSMIHNICDSRQGWQIQPGWHVVALPLYVSWQRYQKKQPPPSRL